MIIPLLLSRYLDSYDDNLKSIIDLYLDGFEYRMKHRGLDDTLAYYKKVRLSFTRYLCGSPLLNLEGLNINSKGLCTENQLLVDYLNTQSDKGHRTEALRAIMTLLTIGRSFYSKAVLDTSTITDP